ncbi:MAG: tRNA (adenosine(37)-N6)-threonylcarbamoyltransferase complex dimerization subunit type 1 TsaB, partial [Actinomycetes bacterium]|nr:tRNA (adenosine(37)-N6)-threonylcarbamoyltransferase complex dimerization subunit type 1 TsaB [Actinomycetes bacterium]
MSENVRYLLAFDTAGDTVHLGLAAFLPDGRGCAPARVVAIEAPRAANAVLLEAITQVLDAEGIGLSDLAAIAVGCSLGSYTGVRIGVATAKGLAQGLGIGLYGVATGAGELRGGKGADGGEEAVGAEACAAGDTNGQALVDAFVASYAQASGDVAAVLPYYTRLSYAEEAELQRSQIKESQKPVMPGLTRHLKPASQETFEASDGQQSARLRGQKAVPTQGLPSGDSGDVTCRRLTPMDVAALVALAGEVEGFGWSRASLIEELNNPTRLWFGTLRREGEGLWRLIGCVGAADLAGELNVLMLAVASGERRRGVARALLDLLLEQARERRIASATLEVRADNEAAIRLYRSAGFTQTGRRTGYYPQAATPVGTPSAPGGRLASGGQQSAAPRQKAVPMDALLFACSLTLPEFARPLVLGIESSCDETAAAVVAGDALLSNVVASQVQFHARFGGVVPEIASRKHSEAIVSTVDEALRQAASAGETRLSFAAVDAIAVTDRPGLIGALVVGLAYAKGLAAATGKPLYGINHLEGHLYAVLLDTATVPDHRALPVPHVALIVSGGHTS